MKKEDKSAIRVYIDKKEAKEIFDAFNNIDKTVGSAIVNRILKISADSDDSISEDLGKEWNTDTYHAIVRNVPVWFAEELEKYIRDKHFSNSSIKIYK